MRKILIGISLLLLCSMGMVSAETAGLSTTEQAFGRLGIEGAEDLRQYGYDLLSETVPVHSILIDKDYAVNPGDELRIYIWGDSVEIGTIEGLYEVTVNLDGGLFLAPAGRISAYGRTLAEIEKTLNEILNYKYNNISVDVALTKLHDFTIYVTGFVNRPGLVTINSLWSIVETLGYAGGIAPEGSLRRIELRRDGKITLVDLYDLFQDGVPIDMKMQEGDVINVPAVSKSCAITGQVKRPGIYEMIHGETVNDLLEYAGGLQVAGAALSARLIQQDGKQVRIVETSSNIRDIQDRFLADGDLILLSPSNTVSSNIVKVSGAVLYPGIFDINKNSDTVSELLKRVELRYNADMEFATLFRDSAEYENDGIVFSPKAILDGSAEDIPLQQYDEITIYTAKKRFMVDPVKLTGLVSEAEVIPYREGLTVLDVINDVEFTEDFAAIELRIVRDEVVAAYVDLFDLYVSGNTAQNVPLASGDMIVAVEKEHANLSLGIQVLGQVNTPGIYPYAKGVRLSDVLEDAGWFTDQAYPQALVLIRKSIQDEQLKQLKKRIAVTQSDLDALEASLAIQEDLSADEKNLVKAQIAGQRTLLESAMENQGDLLGRIALELPADAAEFATSSDDILLSEGDYIYVPKRSDYVSILGDVDSTIALPWREGKTIREYLMELGGLRARDYDISIIKHTGRVIKDTVYFWNTESIEKEILEPGDVIFVIDKIKIPAGTQVLQGLSDVTDAVYKIIYSLDALNFF